MCIAILKEEGSVISEDTLNNCWQSNPDGAGFMYAKDKQLIMKKGFMKFQDFLEAYQEVGESVAVIHFRIKTHGTTNPENTHPFMVVDGKLGFVHNGIITNAQTKDKSMSDTWNFNEQILKPMVAFDGQFLARKHNWDLIKAFIGGSKLIFLDNKGQSAIMNEQMGTWEEGVWYSNSSYKPKPKVTAVTHYKHNYSKKYLDDGFFLPGDFVKVVNKRWQNAPYKIGEVGMINKLHGSGYVQVIFHRTNDVGDVVEITSTLHEDDLQFKHIYGAV